VTPTRRCSGHYANRQRSTSDWPLTRLDPAEEGGPTPYSMACLYPKVAIILPTTPHLTFKTRALSKPPLRFLTGDSRPGACSSPSKALSGYGSEEKSHRLQVQDEPRSAQGIEEDRGGIQWSREELGSGDHGVVTRAVSPDRPSDGAVKRDRACSDKRPMLCVGHHSPIGDLHITMLRIVSVVGNRREVRNRGVAFPHPPASTEATASSGQDTARSLF
jgi:hypothetical protein